MRQVQAVIENEDDTEVQQVLRQHYHEVPPLRPEMRAVLRMTALVVYNMRVNGSRLTPRSALILLAQADWDVELAQYRYQQQRDSDDSGEAKEESERSDGEEDEEDEEDEEEEEGEDDGAGSDVSTPQGFDTIFWANYLISTGTRGPLLHHAPPQSRH